MHPSTDAMNDLWQANMEAARQYGQLALDSAEQLFKAQAESLRDICDLGANEYVYFWSGNSGKPLDHLPDLMAKRLDFAVAMGRQYQDGALRFQTTLYQIAENQMPVFNRCMQDAIDAALAPA